MEGKFAGWFAPEYKLLREAWRDIKEICKPITARVSEQEKRLELVTGGIIECWAFDRNENAGRSRRYHRVVIDEAAHCKGLEVAWTKGIRPTLADYQGDAWFLSSPNGENYFYQLFQRGLGPSKAWRSWQQTSYDNPYIPASEIDDARDELPEIAFRQEWLAEFLAENHDVLIPPDWVARMLDPGIVAGVERMRAEGSGGARYLAADLSLGTGRDRTVIVVRDRLGILAVHRSAWTGLAGAAGVIARLMREHGIPAERAFYDASGIGRDLAKHLEGYRVDATPYHGSASGGARYRNRRTACAWRLRQRLDPERPETPDAAPRDDGNPWRKPRRPKPAPVQPPFACPANLIDAEGRADLAGLRWRPENGKVSLENKDEFMERLGRSPDFADALIMTFNRTDG